MTRKKLLFIPAPVGLGDLVVVDSLVDRLHRDYDLTTALWDKNKDSELARGLNSARVIVPSSKIEPSVDYLNGIASMIKEVSPDAVIVINYPSSVFASVAAGVPVIQLTHQFDEFGLGDNEASLEWDVSSYGSIEKYLGLNRFNITAGNLSFLEDLEYGAFPNRQLFEQSMIYLSYVLSNHLIVHSFFPSPDERMKQLNTYRSVLNNSDVRLASPVIPAKVLEYKEKRDNSRSYVDQRFGIRRDAPLVLVTFGGFDHETSNAFNYLIKGFKGVYDSWVVGDSNLVFVGKIIDKMRGELEQFFQRQGSCSSGRVRFVGSVDHDDHLRLMSASDLVISHPGYSTISEVVGMNRPLALFYGLTPTYERQLNLQQANQAGLCLRGDERRYWMQLLGYHSHDSQYEVSPDDVVLFLSNLFKEVGQVDRPNFDNVVEAQRRSLRRYPSSVLETLPQTLERI